MTPLYRISIASSGYTYPALYELDAELGAFNRFPQHADHHRDSTPRDPNGMLLGNLPNGSYDLSYYKVELVEVRA